MYPGEEGDPSLYRLNPGEGFAEAYRVLNERRLGRAETPWRVVSDVLYPDAAALAAVEQDVTAPWTRNTVTVTRGSFTRSGRAIRTASFSTPLDGTMTVSVRAPRSVRLRVELVPPAGRPLAQATVAGGQRTLRHTICGTRTLRIRVTRMTGAGAYRLSVAKP